MRRFWIVVAVAWLGIAAVGCAAPEETPGTPPGPTTEGPPAPAPDTSSPEEEKRVRDHPGDLD